MELYTSLVRLKQTLNNGQLPPMTPLPDEVRQRIDPAFTINGDGWGGVVEDAHLGLQCPVRGCGKWFHYLASHMNKSHADLGGAPGFRSLMSIPSTAPLVSSKLADQLSVSFERRQKRMSHSYNERAGRLRLLDRKAIQRKGRAKVVANSKTAGALNLADSCPAQFIGKIAALHAQIGRTPTAAECVAEYGSMIVPNAVKVFGSWNSAIAFCGIEPNPRGNTRRTKRGEVLDSLQAWVDAHGDLPTSKDIACVDRLPRILGYKAIMHGLGAATWTGAMKIAAALLDIHGGRYGLSPRERSA